MHDFEIDIPANVGLGGALDVLENRGDFARYVSAMADYAVLDETSSGKISASSADYNSVFLGIELGQTFLEPSLSRSGQWGVRTAKEEVLTDENGTGYVYPALTLTSFDAFNIRVTSLANDIPYDREALIHQDGNNFFVRGSEYWERNTHSSRPGLPPCWKIPVCWPAGPVPDITGGAVRKSLAGPAIPTPGCLHQRPRG